MTPPVLVWLLLATIWGSTWLFIKVGLEAGLPPFTFAGVRFAIAAMPLVLWMLVRGVRLPRSGADWWLMVWTGLATFSLNYGLVFWGESHISSGLAAILYSTFPIMGMAIAHYVLPDEPLGARKILGVLLAVAGVGLIFYTQIDVRGRLALLGSVAIVVAAFVTAYSGVMIKRSGTHIEPVTMSAVQIVVGFVPMLAIGIPLEGNPLHYDWSPRAIVAVVYLALVGSSLTFVLLYWLMQRMQVTRTQMIPLWSTMIAVLLGNLVLGEAFSWRVLVGAAVILLGLFVATRREVPGRA
jgi:drug/metabolite transporter (DMT)-like permease